MPKTWSNGKGRIVVIKKMDCGHLINAIKYLKKIGKNIKGVDGYSKYRALDKEAKRRGIFI